MMIKEMGGPRMAVIAVPKKPQETAPDAWRRKHSEYELTTNYCRKIIENSLSFVNHNLGLEGKVVTSAESRLADEFSGVLVEFTDNAYIQMIGWFELQEGSGLNFRYIPNASVGEKSLNNILLGISVKHGIRWGTGTVEPEMTDDGKPRIYVTGDLKCSIFMTGYDKELRYALLVNLIAEVEGLKIKREIPVDPKTASWLD